MDLLAALRKQHPSPVQVLIPSLSIQPGSTSRRGWCPGWLGGTGHFLLMGCTDAGITYAVVNSHCTAVHAVVVIHGEQENLLLSSGKKLQSFGFQSPHFSGITGSNPERVKQGLSSSETDGVSRSKLPMILFVRCCVTFKMHHDKSWLSAK